MDAEIINKYELYIYPKMFGEYKFRFVVEQSLNHNCGGSTQQVDVLYLNINKKSTEPTGSFKLLEYNEQIEKLYEEANKAFNLELDIK